VKVLRERERRLTERLFFRPRRLSYGEIGRDLFFCLLLRRDFQSSSDQARNLAFGIADRETTDPNPAKFSARPYDPFSASKARIIREDTGNFVLRRKWNSGRSCTAHRSWKQLRSWVFSSQCYCGTWR